MCIYKKVTFHPTFYLWFLTYNGKFSGADKECETSKGYHIRTATTAKKFAALPNQSEICSEHKWLWIQVVALVHFEFLLSTVQENKVK